MHKDNKIGTGTWLVIGSTVLAALGIGIGITAQSRRGSSRGDGNYSTYGDYGNIRIDAASGRRYRMGDCKKQYF